MVKMRFLILNVSAGEITLGRRQHVARELQVERGMAYTAPLSNSSQISHSGGRLETLRVLIFMKNYDTLVTSIPVGRKKNRLLDSGGETLWNTAIRQNGSVSGTGCVDGR